MKKIPLLILFAAVFLMQLAFPLKTIVNQCMAKKYGIETLEDAKICDKYYHTKYAKEHYVCLGNKGEFFLKKDIVKILSDFDTAKINTKLKIKTLGENKYIEDLIIEGIALKNPSKEDLELLKTRLSKQSESAQKNSDDISEK